MIKTIKNYILLIITALCISVMPSFLSADSQIYVGPYFASPGKDLVTGMLFGLNKMKNFDEVVSATYGFELMFSSYSEKKDIGTSTTESGNTQTSTIVTYDRKLYLLPISFNLLITPPMNFKAEPYLSLGIGWEFLFDYYYVRNEASGLYSYGWFGYKFGLGVKLPLGSSTDVFFELAYNLANPRLISKQTRLYSYQDVDMGGVALKVGINFF